VKRKEAREGKAWTGFKVLGLKIWELNLMYNRSSQKSKNPSNNLAIKLLVLLALSLVKTGGSILSPWSHEWWICELHRLLTLNHPLIFTLDNLLELNKFCQKSKPAVTPPLCTSRSTSIQLCIESITHFGSDNIVDMSIAEHCNLHLRNHISMLASLIWIYTTVKQMAQYISLRTWRTHMISVYKYC